MQIQTNSHSPIEPSRSSTTEPAKSTLSAYEQGKKLQDVAILSAVASQNSSADNPMKLLYKTAIEEINKELEPTLGDNSVQSSYDTELDVSPEATADRIINSSTAFYQAFKEQNSDLSDEESLDAFINVIGTGIDKGFEDAKGILDSLQVLEGDVETNIDSTYDFVQEGLANFRELILERLAENMTSQDESNTEEVSA